MAKKLDRIKPSTIDNNVYGITHAVMMKVIPLLNELVDRVQALEAKVSGPAPAPAVEEEPDVAKPRKTRRATTKNK